MKEKVCKFIENYKPIYPKKIMNKQNKHNLNHFKAHHNQIVEIQ